MEALVYLIFIGAGTVGALIGNGIAYGINHWMVDKLLDDSIIRIIINLFITGCFSFFGAFISLIFIIGFAADENAGAIVPYYVWISVGLAVVSMLLYYQFFRSVVKV